ncbi:MAG: tetratricopeptide repeat protein [Pseudomonadota bacterium]
MLRDSRLATVVGAAALAAYFNALFGSFQFDDYNVIVHNPAVHSAAAWFESMPGIRALLKLSYTLNWIAGPAPFGFHLFNVAVHAANAALVYFLFCALRDRLPASAARWAPFLGALLFALHPVHTEAVAYVSGRSVSLMALFYLGGVLAYLRADASPAPGKLRAISAALFAAALLTRETAVTLPLALLLCDATDPHRRPFRDILQHQSLHWLILIAATLVMVASPTYRHLLEVSLSTRTVAENLLSQINAIWYLGGQLLMPWRLNVDPDLAVAASWTPSLALQAALLAGAVAAGFANLRRRSWLAFALLWFFIHLLPTNSVLPRLDLANDRQLYLASVGVFLVAAIALQRLLERAQRRWVVNALVGIMLLGLGYATAQRNETYRSEVSFWEDAATKSPHKARVFNNLGFVYQQAGRLDAAEQAYLRALELDPKHPRAYWNLENLRATSPQPSPPARASVTR